jgi:hypothetical protein
MFMFYLHSSFHMPISNCSFVIAVKLQAKGYIRTAAMLLFYSLQKKSQEGCIFFQ